MYLGSILAKIIKYDTVLFFVNSCQIGYIELSMAYGLTTFQSICDCMQLERGKPHLPT